MLETSKYWRQVDYEHSSPTATKLRLHTSITKFKFHHQLGVKMNFMLYLTA